MDLAHVALNVSDLEAAVEFYEGIGLERRWSFTLDGIENVYLGDESDALQLRHDPDRTTPIAPSRADVDHVALTVEDVDETFAQAVDLGAPVVLEPTEIDGADAYAAFVEDPEGYTLELFESL